MLCYRSLRPVLLLLIKPYKPMTPTLAHPYKNLTALPREVQEITCYKEEGHWYISAATFVVQKGQQAYTRLAVMADGFIGWISRKRSRFTMHLHTAPFEGARMLELEELCTGPDGGAWYRLPTSKAPGHQHRIWVCDSSLVIFGDLPQRIFFRRVKGE